MKQSQSGNERSSQGPRSCLQSVSGVGAGAKDFRGPQGCLNSAFLGALQFQTPGCVTRLPDGCELPVAGTNGHNLSSLKQHKFMTLRFWRSESEMGLLGKRSKSHQDGAFSERRRKNLSSPFPAPMNHLLSLAHDLVILMSPVT